MTIVAAGPPQYIDLPTITLHPQHNVDCTLTRRSTYASKNV